jgi:sugar lactone lactonase YvrE
MSNAKLCTSPLPSKVIYQFPFPTWIENIAVRSNGQLLVTLLTTPELYLIDPETSEARLVSKFDSVLALTGIIEIEEDVFYIAGGNYNSSNLSNEVGSYHIWKVDMTSFNTTSKAAVNKIAQLSEAGLPNGFELLSKADGTILIADSELGAVWKLNTQDGTCEIAIEVDEMKYDPLNMPMGVNGIKIAKGYLYWSNTSKATICRIKIDKRGVAIGKAEVLEENVLVDDFVFDKKGIAWLTTNPMNTVVVMTKMGEGGVTVIGGKNELTVAGGTACQFGRLQSDEHILYVVTTGGLVSPVDGDKVEGGKIVAIDTSQFML